MDYFIDLPVPSLTPATSLAKVTQPIHAGTITEIVIYFPDGCCNLVHVAVRDDTQQIVPFNQQGFVTGNHADIHFMPQYAFYQPPLELYVVGYSEDDTYLHTPRVKITVSTTSVSPLLNAMMAGH